MSRIYTVYHGIRPGSRKFSQWLHKCTCSSTLLLPHSSCCSVLAAPQLVDMVQTRSRSRTRTRARTNAEQGQGMYASAEARGLVRVSLTRRVRQ